MRTPLSYIALVLLLTAQLCSMPLAAQDSSTYKLDFVRAGWFVKDSHNMVVVVLKVTPTSPDFVPVLSFKISYDIGDGERSMAVSDNPDIRITVYGNDVETKSKVIHRFVKDHVDLENEKDILLLRFDFRDLTPERVQDMWFKYGLWEGENNEIRHEKEFRFPVEDMGE
jgi:hypothetical protein